jgi:hypothetical protein
MPLTFNPSYSTNEVTYGSCPPKDFVNSTFSNVDFTKNIPRVHGDSMLGIYDETFQRFEGSGNFRCFPCNMCEQNSITPLFYRPPRQILHTTYGVEYRGKDNYYRKPY